MIEWLKKPKAYQVFLTLAVAGVLHHYGVCGRWFDWETLAHHEPIIAACVVLGLWEIIRSLIRR